MINTFLIPPELSKRIVEFAEKNKVPVNMPALDINDAEDWLLQNTDKMLDAYSIASSLIWDEFGNELEAEALTQYPCNYPTSSMSDLHPLVQDHIAGTVSAYSLVKLNIKGVNDY